MSDTTNAVAGQAVLTPKQQLENTENVRDLFARAHDYIAQAQHPGHMGMKVAEVLSFLKFHYEDFKLRCETQAKQIEVNERTEMYKVNVEAAKAATEAVLNVKQVVETEASEAPKA